eukprot:PITA_04122
MAIQELLALGHIRPNSSPFDSSVVLVKKKDDMLRMCIDYKALSKKTLKNRYPIPQINELMDELRGTKKFVKGFSQLAAPLIDLTKKGAFTWTDKAQATFEHLKEVMSSCPVLALPNHPIVHFGVMHLVRVWAQYCHKVVIPLLLRVGSSSRTRGYT